VNTVVLLRPKWSPKVSDELLPAAA
jgi:hypothetical protein